MLNNKKASATTIIGVADGPTSIFIAGKTGSKGIGSLRQMLRKKLMLYKRKKAANKIIPDPHTIDEVIEYTKKKYGAVEISGNAEDFKLRRYYLTEKESRKISLVLENKPELVGGKVHLEIRNLDDQKQVEEFWKKIDEQNEKAAALSDEEFPMDFHLYFIEGKNAKLEIHIEKIWNFVCVGISAQGKKNDYKKLNKIQKDIMLYYGVSEEDIKEKTIRYQILLSVLVE